MGVLRPSSTSRSVTASLTSSPSAVSDSSSTRSPPPSLRLPLPRSKLFLQTQIDMGGDLISPTSLGCSLRSYLLGSQRAACNSTLKKNFFVKKKKKKKKKK